MLKYSFYHFIIIFYSIIALTWSDKPEETYRHSVLVKRNEKDLQACLKKFDIHSDKIIRTQDSKAMGAKFLNSRDVGSRQECLQMCCGTENCDVFVYEEKNPGSCYLFECGSPEDFKCKFTKHKNYTSAVLNVIRHLTELETQIKFTQHEHELAKLREPGQDDEQSPTHMRTTTEAPLNKESIHLIPSSQTSKNEPNSIKCSMNQFTCHSSGECIAIYNACDGIAQCSDGSDEGPELNCPGQTSTTSPKPNADSPQTNTMMQEKIHINENSKYSPNNQQFYQPNTEFSHQHQWSQEQYMRKSPEAETMLNRNNPSGSSQSQGIPQNIRANYGREGEGLPYAGEQPWQYQYHPNTGASQIFTHKGSGLVQQPERFQHQFNPVDTVAMNGNQYNEPNQNEFMKYNNYQDSMPYRRYPQGPQMNNNWDVHKTHELPQGTLGEDISSGNVERSRNGNLNPPDYYYEDYRRGPQLPVRFPPQPSNFQPPAQANSENHPENLKHIEFEKDQKNSGEMDVRHHETSTKQPETATIHQLVPVTIIPKAEATHIHSAHSKMEKLTAEVSLRESAFPDSEVDGHNSSPSGAILSLTFGLCITAIMVVLVSCRMRMVQRRMRRGGKSPYAHDADFLVNGMYL